MATTGSGAHKSRHSAVGKDAHRMGGMEIALYAARMADQRKAEDIVIYDVRGKTDLTDFLVIATVHSRQQARAISEGVRQDLRDQGIRPMGIEGYETAQWVLLDFVDAIIHLFSPELREYYSLESLWGDAPKVAFAEETPPAKD